MQAISLHNSSARLASSRRPSAGRVPAKVAANASKVPAFPQSCQGRVYKQTPTSDRPACVNT